MIVKKVITEAGVNRTQPNNTNGGSNGSGIRYSDPETRLEYPKYLDQNGVQEIVTQFKAYCDNLVGGA